MPIQLAVTELAMAKSAVFEDQQALTFWLLIFIHLASEVNFLLNFFALHKLTTPADLVVEFKIYELLGEITPLLSIFDAANYFGVIVT